MRDLALGTMFSLRFQFSTPFAKFVEKGINLEAKDVFYDYINATLMTCPRLDGLSRRRKSFM